MAEAIKTIKIKIVNPNKGKKDALSATVSYLNRVLETYLSLTLQHQEIFLKVKETVNKKTGEVCIKPLSNAEILTFLEKLSLKTKAHPKTEINIKSLFPGLPTLWRRSCINTSTGMVRSYLSNFKRWESQREFTDARSGLSAMLGCDALTRRLLHTTPSTKKGHPPSPPKARNLPTCYKGVFTIELFDIHNQFVRLKVFYGKEWVWKNYPVKLGRKQLKQLNDQNWSMQSPTLVPKQTKRGIEWYLHIPLVKKVSVKPIKEQKKENPSLTTLAVDLGLRHLAVVTVRFNREIVFVKFFRGEQVEAHRLQHLQKVFRKQLRSGKPVRGERSNKQLWRHIKDTNTDIAHQVTKEIVSIAKKYDVKVIVIEHLHKFQARKGEKRSSKLNRKLTYWLKGKMEEQLRYKAFAEGILVKSVSPAFTSQICKKCGGFGERFSHKSLFRCHYCGYEANADFNASVNLHKVFWGTFPFPKKKQKLKKPADVRG